MKATVLHAPRDVRYQEVAEPQIQKLMDERRAIKTLQICVN